MRENESQKQIKMGPAPTERTRVITCVCTTRIPKVLQQEKKRARKTLFLGGMDCCFNDNVFRTDLHSFCFPTVGTATCLALQRATTQIYIPIQPDTTDRENRGRITTTTTRKTFFPKTIKQKKAPNKLTPHPLCSSNPHDMNIHPTQKPTLVIRDSSILIDRPSWNNNDDDGDDCCQKTSVSYLSKWPHCWRWRMSRFLPVGMWRENDCDRRRRRRRHRFLG